MALEQDSQFYQASGANAGFTASDRRKFSYGQLGSPHELVNPIVHVVGGLVLSGADVFDYTSGAVTPFTFDHYGRLKTDSQLVLSGGDVQIGAVEIKGSVNDWRVDTQIDNEVTVGSPVFIPIGGKYFSGAQTYTNTDAVVAQFNDQGALKVTGGGGVPASEFKSPKDFSATYTSTTTITLSSLSNLTITDSSQIVYIKQITSAGVGIYYTNGQDGVTITVSSNVLTISGAGTPLVSGDVYEIGINGQKKAFDPSTNSNMESVLNPVYAYNMTEHLVDLGSATAPSNVVMTLGNYTNWSAQIELGSPAGSLTIDYTNDTSTSPVYQDRTLDLTGSAFLMEDQFFVVNNVNVDRVRFTISGAPTTSDIYIKRWY